MSQQVYVDPSVKITAGQSIVGWDKQRQATVRTTPVVSVVSDNGREAVVRTEAGGDYAIVRR